MQSHRTAAGNWPSCLWANSNIIKCSADIGPNLFSQNSFQVAVGSVTRSMTTKRRENKNLRYLPSEIKAILRVSALLLRANTADWIVSKLYRCGHAWYTGKYDSRIFSELTDRSWQIGVRTPQRLLLPRPAVWRCHYLASLFRHWSRSELAGFPACNTFRLEAKDLFDCQRVHKSFALSSIEKFNGGLRF